jgi:hypothetical protein
MALLVGMSNCFGVLECWSIGVLKKAETPGFNHKILALLHYSITPSLLLTLVRRKDSQVP